MKKFRESVVKALLPHIVLANAPIHGYDLIKLIRELYGVYLSPSTVYPALADLEKLGLIQSEWIEPQEGERPRKVYTITGKGRLQLNQTSTVLALVNKTIEV